FCSVIAAVGVLSSPRATAASARILRLTIDCSAAGCARALACGSDASGPSSSRTSEVVISLPSTVAATCPVGAAPPLPPLPHAVSATQAKRIEIVPLFFIIFLASPLKDKNEQRFIGAIPH